MCNHLQKSIKNLAFLVTFLQPAEDFGGKCLTFEYSSLKVQIWMPSRFLFLKIEFIPLCVIQHVLHYLSGSINFLYMFLMYPINLSYSDHFECNRFSEVQMEPEILTRQIKLEEQI